MRKYILVSILSLVVGMTGGWFVFKQSLKIGLERKILYYRDPMNPKNTSDMPKKASDGMDYVPVYEEVAVSSGGKKVAYYHDPMHPWYTSDKPGKAPDCGMDLVPVYEGSEDTKGIKIDPLTVQNIGVKSEEAKILTLSKTIRATGKIDMDETKIYSINTKYMGWVEKLYVDYTGRFVRKGEALMEFYSPDLVSAQQEYLQAYQYKQQMDKSNVDEMKKSAAALLESTKQKLLYWDIPESDITQLENSGKAKKTMTIYSSFEGIVMNKMVVKGQNVMPGMEMYRIADLSTVWIYADIYQFEMPWVKIGQEANVDVSYLPGQEIKGKITYIYPTLNMETKTVRVRIEVMNTPTFDLKPEMFVTVRILSPITIKTIAVPEQAIIHSGERNIAVIALGGGYFEPREVKLGVTANGYVQILHGIHQGENIVVSSQFLIDSESNLKAAISQMSAKPMLDTSMNTANDSAMIKTQAYDKSDSKASENKQVYTCEMHPEVTSDKPGDCPKCGMKLILKK